MTWCIFLFSLRSLFVGMFVNLFSPVSDIYAIDGVTLNRSLKELETQSQKKIKAISFVTNYVNNEFNEENSLTLASQEYLIYLSEDPNGNVKICTNFDSFKVYDCSYMFSRLDSLCKINLTGIDVSESKSMRSMFQDCVLLESVDLSVLKTHNVKNMMDMFSGCVNLQWISFDGLDLSKLEIVIGLFRGCKSLKDVSFRNTMTKTVKRTEDMFLNCEKLIHLEISDLDLSEVTYAARMFKNCSSLECLNLNNFSARNLEIADEMFFGCSSLEILGLQNMQTTNRPGLTRMFYGAFRDNGNLFLGKKFKIEDCDVYDELFRGCGHISIKGKIRLRNKRHLLAILKDGVKSSIENDSVFP